MKKFAWGFVLYMIGLTVVSLGCNSDPGEAKVEPTTKEETDQNMDVGKVPGS